MENKIILSKESSDNDIRRYFEAVLKLSQSDNKFPINLDAVWMLVYNRKDYATDVLKKDFIEDVDYITTSVKTEVGSNKIEYRLTVSCMEFFIARKVRPVFEVYRKVFHKSVEVVKQIRNENQQEQLSMKDMMQAATWAAKFLKLNDASKLLMAKQILEPTGLILPEYVDSKGFLLAADKLLKKNGINLNSHKFNLLMKEHGYVDYRERPSRSKGVKKFPILTEKGLKYGENQVSPHNQKETQIQYYEDKFPELVKHIGLQPQSQLF